MTKILEFLSGKKTYFVMAVAIISAVVLYLNGELDLAGLITTILGSLGLGTIRAAVKKTE